MSLRGCIYIFCVRVKGTPVTAVLITSKRGNGMVSCVRVFAVYYLIAYSPSGFLQIFEVLFLYISPLLTQIQACQMMCNFNEFLFLDMQHL